MMVHVPEVLSPQQVARCREVMEKAAWVDGRATAGPQSAKVKHNLQLPEDSAEARELMIAFETMRDRYAQAMRRLKDQG